MIRISNNSISLCLIVKNEEQNIERCLRSVQGVVKEMIVVDTGSNDRTKELATALGAKVYGYKWDDNFSAARNYGLRHATGDWILHLDADEALAGDDDRDALKRVVDDTEAIAFYLLVEDASSGESNGAIRLFRNDKKFRYKGIIHETISLPPLKSGEKTVEGVDITVMHYGYSLSNFELAQKEMRNHEILKKAYQKNPNDPRVCYYLGLHADGDNRLSEAVRYFEEAFKNDHRHENPYVNRNLAMVLEHMGRFDEALKYVDDGIEHHPQYTDLYYLKGLLLMRTGDLGRAVACFEKALEIGPAVPVFPRTPETGGRFAKRELATCYVQMGRLTEARDLYVSVLEEDPRDIYALRAFAKLLIAHHDKDRVREELVKLVDVQNVNVKSVMNEMFGA